VERVGCSFQNREPQSAYRPHDIHLRFFVLNEPRGLQSREEIRFLLMAVPEQSLQGSGALVDLRTKFSDGNF
jgi:hypothetical protein